MVFEVEFSSDFFENFQQTRKGRPLYDKHFQSSDLFDFADFLMHYLQEYSKRQNITARVNLLSNLQYEKPCSYQANCIHSV